MMPKAELESAEENMYFAAVMNVTSPRRAHYLLRSINAGLSYERKTWQKILTGTKKDRL